MMRYSRLKGGHMHIDRPWITLPLLVPVVFNMFHQTHTGTLIPSVAILALAAVRLRVVDHARNLHP